MTIKLSLIGLLTLTTTALAQQKAGEEGSYWDRHIVRHIDMSDGLPHNYVDAISEDPDGGIWMALNGGGVVRYDGYTFHRLDETTPASLRSNFVHSIACDTDGLIWIGGDEGLDVYDREHARMLEPDTTGAKGRDGLRGQPVLDIVVDSHKNIWARTQHSLTCIRRRGDGEIEIVDKVKTKNVFSAMSRSGEGVVAAMGDEIVTAMLEGDHIVTRQRDMEALTRLGGVVLALLDTEEVLWIGTDRGLIREDSRTGATKTMTHSETDDNSISQNCVTDLAVGRGGEILVATLRGINVGAERDGAMVFERLMQSPTAHGKSITSNFVNCIYASRQGIWVGTEVAGVDFIAPTGLKATHYSSMELGSVGKAEHEGGVQKPVNAIVESADGGLWVGSVEGGLSYRAPGATKFTNYTHETTGISHNSISCMSIDERGRLWIGTWGGGFNILDVSDRGKPRVLRHIGAAEMGSDFIGSMMVDTLNHGMWVASIHAVAFVSDDGDIRFPLEKDITNGMNGAIGAAIDNQGRLWMGISKGLVIVDLSSYDGEHVRSLLIDHELDDEGSHQSPRVTFVHSSHISGKTYVATNGYGFYEVREEEDGTFRFARCSTADGLTSNTVVGMAEDAEGDFWISTSCGLSVMRHDSHTWARLTTSEGLLADCYYWNAAATSWLNGHAYFGSLAGLTEIEGFRVSGTESPTPPILTRLEVANQTVIPQEDGIIDKDINFVREISIHESEKSFGIEFSAFEYTSPLTTKYEYKLDGFDDTWVTPAAGVHNVHYTNLTPGRYVLHIRTSGAEGTWSPERTLQISVRPYFYKTPAFIVAMIVGALLAIYLWVRRRIARVEEAKRELHEQVMLRTRELQDSNEELMAQNAYITRQKEDMAEMAERIQKLSVDKLQFFTNISHELRSPLTLITGPVRRAMSLTTQADVRQQLEMVDRSAQTLLTTVNQLMDFRKVDTDNMDLHPVSTQVVPLITETARPYVAYAAERGIALSVLTHIGAKYAKMDSDAMQKIITNLLSNAIKYSPDGSHIRLYACQLTHDGRPWLYIGVRDEGPGIPADKVDKIFTSFYQVHKADGSLTSSHGMASSGIGLYLVGKLVALSGGEIEARNNPRPARGLTMRVMLPLQECESGAPEIEEREYDAAVLEEDTATPRGMTILVVDDSADMRTYIRTVLEDEYNIVEAPDGLQGLAALSEHDVDFIITDLMMPAMDGLEFTRRVKSNLSYSHTPVLILTAQMADEYQTESYRVGVECYLHKPFDEKMLRARIAGILKQRQEDQKKFAITLNAADLNIESESADEKFVRRVTEHVREHYKDPDYSIQDIVNEMGCSKSLLHKKMQTVMGQTPGNFIRSYRLNMARELLNRKEQNNMNVSQIAYEVGFNDPKYFSRCFAKEFGYPPSQE